MSKQQFHSAAAWLPVWATAAAFGAYFCMYGLRKPFTAAAYDGLLWWGLSYKSVLVTAQVFGYTLAKFIGIRVIAALPPPQRASIILWLSGAAHLSLLLFALVPAPWQALCLFFNGLPLGLIFGLVLGFLEGRRLTELLTAGLCASFILADGVTKSVGAYLLAAGVAQFWMPFVAGAVFVLPLLFFVWMLTRIPPPDAADIAQRHERAPLTRQESLALVRKYALGLTLLCGVYLLLTLLRSVRADFAPELWRGLGYSGQPAVFAQSELWVACGALLANGLAVLIRDNRRAFFAALTTAALGFAFTALGLLGWRGGWLSGFNFMVLIGLGLYLPYVAVHTTIFERLLALTGERGNSGFLLYLADSFGYLAYVAVLLARNLYAGQTNLLEFFLVLTGLTASVALVLLASSWLYFAARTRTLRASLQTAETMS